MIDQIQQYIKYYNGVNYSTKCVSSGITAIFSLLLGFLSFKAEKA